MRKTVQDKIQQILKIKLDIKKKYIAAVSGGADSMALAEGLWQAGFTFSVCHVEHGIRGKESLEDAQFVEAYCRHRAIPFYCSTVHAPEFSKRKKLSLEDAARQLRYKALLQCAENAKADFILTAHQKDDQAETFLLRLLRGSGTRGLGGIRFQRDKILRPLLSFSGEELRKYCIERGIQWREDATNLDLQFARNRVRKQLIPLLKESFSPAVTNILCRTSVHLQEDSDYLEGMAAKELRLRLLKPISGQNSVLDISGWNKVPKALRFRILQQFWDQLGSGRELVARNLDDLALLIEKRSSGAKILLPGGLQALRSYDKIILFSSGYLKTQPCGDTWRCDIYWNQIPYEAKNENEKDLVIDLPDGRMVQLALRRDNSYIFRWQMIYPFKQLQQMGDCLTFRCRQPGDRFFPLKGTGHKTLKKYLIECKVPVEKRATLTLAAVADEVVWIPGVANARWKDEKVADSQSRDWLFIKLI